MEEKGKKKPNKVLIIVIAVIVFIILTTTPIIFTFIKAGSIYKNAKDNIKNKTSLIENNNSEETTSNKCIYADLPDVDKLSNEEKESLKTAIVNQYNFTGNISIVDSTFVIEKTTDKLYKVEFKTANTQGSNAFIGYVWKENGVWKTDGFGSDYSTSELNALKFKICSECNSCPDECLYSDLKDISALTDSEKKAIISEISKIYSFEGKNAVVESSIVFKKETNKIYRIEFRTANTQGSNWHIGYAWKEFDKYDFDGFGSDYSTDDLEALKTKICSKCNDCNTK